MSLPSRLLGANPSIQASNLLSGSLSTPSAKQAFVPPGEMYAIATYTSTSAFDAFSFLDIPQTYRFLVVRINGSTVAPQDSSYKMRMNTNTDTGSLSTRDNYPSGGSLYHQWLTNNGMLDDGTDSTGSTQSWHFIIGNYTNTTGFKTTNIITGVIRDSGSRLINWTGFANGKNQNPITALYFSHNNGANFFAANSRFTLYGVK